MNKTHTITIAILTLGACSAASHAIPLDAFWVEVPVVDDPTDSEDLTGFRSFDLFVTLQDGDVVYAQDFGVAGPNIGISLGAGQDFYQHPFGGNKAANPNLVNVFPDLVYDTRGQMGTLDWNEYTDVVGTIDWDPDGVGGGYWGVGVPEPGEATADENNRYWFARITVNSIGAFGEQTSDFGEFLGGQLFLGGDGPNGEFGLNIAASGVVDVPNAFAIPSPGAAAMLGVFATGALTRRRRGAVPPSA